MGTTPLQDRFTELVVSVDLLPSVDELHDKVIAGELEIEELVFPNYSEGFSNPILRTAFLCHALSAPTEWQMQSCTLLGNSAMRSIDAKLLCEMPPSDDDLGALTTVITLMWAVGFGNGMIQALHTLSNLCDRFDMELPDSVTALFRSNHLVNKIAATDPYAVLSGAITPDKVFRFVMGADK